MAILPSKRLFLWDPLKYVFFFLPSCLIPVQWRLCSSAFWVSESHSSGDASGCGKVFHPAPSCTGSMFVNSQAWFSEGPFLCLSWMWCLPPGWGLMPSPSLSQGWVPSGETYYPHSLYFPFTSVLWCFPPPGSSHGTRTKLSFSWSALYVRGPASPHCSFGSSSDLPSAIVSILLCSSTTTRILYSLSPSTHSTSKRYPLPAFSFSPPGPRAAPHSLGRDDRTCFRIFYRALSFQYLKRV